MNDLSFLFFHLEVRKFKSPDRVQCQDKGPVGIAPRAHSSQVLPQSTQGAENPRPIKSLTLTVFAVAHGQNLTRFPCFDGSRPPLEQTVARETTMPNESAHFCVLQGGPGGFG